jgi:hypothetical protein
MQPENTGGNRSGVAVYEGSGVKRLVMWEGIGRFEKEEALFMLVEKSNRNRWRDMEIDQHEKTRLHDFIRGEQRVDVLVEGIKRSIVWYSVMTSGN